MPCKVLLLLLVPEAQGNAAALLSMQLLKLPQRRILSFVLYNSVVLVLPCF
jgi:hypothetical protein